MQIGRTIAFCIIAIALATPRDQAYGQVLNATSETLGIKRVHLAASTEIDALTKSEGTLVEIPLGTLEARLDRLVKLQNTAKQTPRLVKTIYRADVVGNYLTNGSGQWLIEHVGSVPAILPFSAFNLALRQPPRQVGREGVFGDVGGGKLGLWIDKRGAQTFDFEWSLRGTPTVQGMSFDVRIPPCPIMSIELKLPADQSLMVPKTSGLLTGPHQTENPAYKIWRLQVTGQSQVEFTVRRGIEPGRAPRIFASIGTSVQFSPEQTLYDADGQIEILHAPVTELVFEVDPALQAYEVSSRQIGVSSWRFETAPASVKPNRNRSLLKIQFREPLLGVLNGLRLRFHGPRWTDREAVLPHIELRGAISHNETLKLHLHPDQHLERWDPGSFRLVNSSTDTDGSQLMTLADTLPDGRTMRPRLSVRTGGVDFTVKQETRWRVDATGMTLSSEIQYDVSRGQLFAFDVRLPQKAAWRIQVELTPRDALQSWNVAGGVLHVDLKRGITPRSDCKLIVTLEADRDQSLARTNPIDIPDIKPLGAKLRQGTLAVLADAHQHISLVQCNVPTTRPDPNLAKDPRLQFYFAFRQTPVQGAIKLAPQRSVLQARTQQQVIMSPEFTRVKANVTIEPIVGQPKYVDLFFSDSGRQPWQIAAKGADITRKERLPLGEVAFVGLRLGAPHPLARAFGTLLTPRGPVWRVHFREPLSKSVELIAQQEIPVPNIGLVGTPPPMLAVDYGFGLIARSVLTRIEREWRVPVVVPLDAARVEGEVSLQPLGTAITGVQPRGMDTATVSGVPSQTFARLFRFKNATLLDVPTLRVTANRRQSDDTTQAILDVAEMTTSLDSAGSVLHHFRASVWNWRARDFRLVLPVESTIVAARLNQIDLDRLPRRASAEGLEVLIPMSQEAGPQTVEVTYQSASNSWFGPLGSVISAPLPKLPLRPLLVERAIRLGPDWLPLRQEELYSLDRRAPAQEAMRSAWRAGDGMFEEISPSVEPSWIERQRLSLLGAEGALRRAGNREISLAEAFSKLLDDPKLDNVGIVLDRTAMRGLGLTPKSTVALRVDGSRPFWENLGLFYVPTPHAALLTSQARAALWAPSIRKANETGTLVNAAVAVGFMFGQDSSGQFTAVDYWQRTESAAGFSGAHLLPSESKYDGMTLWRPIIGRANDDSIILVRSARVRAMSVLLALAVGGACVVLRSCFSVVLLFRCVWLALTICALGLVAAPLSIRELALAPLAIALAMLADCYWRLARNHNVRPAPLRPSRSTQNVVKASLVLAVISTISAWGLCRAQEPETKVAYVIGAETDRDARAFVRPELLRWLNAQEQQLQPAFSDAVFLSARYQGRWGEHAVVMAAEYELITFRDEDTLIVPLTGVDLLEGSFLDGDSILPIVAPAGKLGYQIFVPTKGRHRLTLPFHAHPQPSGELRFSGPMTPCSSLQLTFAPAVDKPRLIRGWGEDALRRDIKTGGQVLEAQLGGEPTIQIQRIAAAPSVPITPPKVREFYFWDLRLTHHSAQAILAYRSAHEVEQMEVQIPNGLEVRSVDLAETGPGQPAGAIKTWRIISRDASRILQIELLQPLVGSFQVLLGMTPRWHKAAGHFELSLPLPLHSELIDGMMGFRVDSSDAATKGQFLSLAAESSEGFIKEWSTLSQRAVGLPLHAFKFVRAANNAASAAFEVAPATDKPHVQSEVMWTALPQTVDLEARLNVSIASSDNDFYMLPINLSQNIVLRDVQGADVHHWSRQGDKLHVWLLGPRRKSSLTLVGWAPHSHPKTMTVSLAEPTVVDAEIDAATLILASASGLALEPKAGLLEELPAESGQRRFKSATRHFPAEFQLQTRSAPPEYEVLTVVEMHDGICTLAAHVRGKIDYGHFPELQFRLSNWPASAARLSHAIAGAKAKRLSSGPEPGWIITTPGDAPQQIAFSITVQLPLQTGQTLRLPELFIERGGQLSEQFVALAGMQFAGPSSIKTSTVGVVATKELSSWPLELARLRNAGAQYVKRSVVAPLPAVQPRETAATPPATILAAHHQVLVGSQNEWLTRMTWSLWTKSGHDVEIELPQDAAFAAAFIDEQPATPSQAGLKTLSLPVFPSQKPHIVTVYWTTARSLESFGRPPLAPARLRGLEPVTVVGELLLPSGWRIAEKNGVADDLSILLSEIQGETRSLQVFGDELASAGKAAQGPIAQSLQNFAALVDRAQYRLRLPPVNDGHARESAEQKLRVLIDDESKRAKSLGVEPMRVAAEKSPWLAPSAPSFVGAEKGAPVSWLQSPGGQAPHIVLRPSADIPPRLSFLSLSVVVFILSFWPLGFATWVRLWPEQLATGLILGFALGGPSLVGIGLLLVAVAGRTLSIIQVARRYFTPSQS